MAVTAHANGTQTCTVTTEHFVSSPSVAGVFVAYFDLVNAVGGDVFVLRAYKKILAGGTSRLLYEEAFHGAQRDPIKGSLSVSNDIASEVGCRFSIEQSKGTGRDVPWVVLKH